MEQIRIVVVQTYGSRPEADLARGALENADIPAMVQADTAGGMREHLAWSGAGFKVLVREEDVTAARDVLAPLRADENPITDAKTDGDTEP
jgi:F420-dependent methylenetetrahydromethanopterin dehydrogenase